MSLPSARGSMSMGGPNSKKGGSTFSRGSFAATVTSTKAGDDKNALLAGVIAKVRKAFCCVVLLSYPHTHIVAHSPTNRPPPSPSL